MDQVVFLLGTFHNFCCNKQMYCNVDFSYSRTHPDYLRFWKKNKFASGIAFFVMFF
jgi:hypothetical protein